MTDHLKIMQAQEAERLRDYELSKSWVCKCGYMNIGCICTKCGNAPQAQSEHRSAQAVGATIEDRYPSVHSIISNHTVPVVAAPHRCSEILEIALRNLAYNTGLSRHDMIKYAAEQLALYNKMMGERR